jgi:hypothetical protein
MKNTPRAYRRHNDDLRSQIRSKLPAVLDIVMAAALSGDIAACKLLLSKALPDLKPESDRKPLFGIDGDDPRAAVLGLLAEGDLDAPTAVAITKALSAPPAGGYPRYLTPEERAERAQAEAERRAAWVAIGLDPDKPL